MRLRTRLNSLEAMARRKHLLSPHGCAACRGRWGLDALVSCEQLPDGTLGPGRDRPLPCAACGRIPERIIEIVEVVVENAGPTGSDSYGSVAANPSALSPTLTHVASSARRLAREPTSDDRLGRTLSDPA